MTRALVWFTAVACTGPVPRSPAGPAPQPPPELVIVGPVHELADGVHRTAIQQDLLVGHFTTLDGKSGFILDRTADPPRVLVDGGPYVMVVTVAETRRCCWDYRATGFVIRIDRQTAEIVDFTDPTHPDGAFVVRDADAAPLALVP